MFGYRVRRAEPCCLSPQTALPPTSSPHPPNVTIIGATFRVPVVFWVRYVRDILDDDDDDDGHGSDDEDEDDNADSSYCLP